MFVVSDPYSAVNDAIGQARVIEVFSGSAGKLAEFSPWQLSPPPLVVNTDAGTAAAIAASYSAAPFTTVNSSQWTGTIKINTVPVFAQLLDGVTYVCLIRTSYASGTVQTTVTVALPPSYTPVTSVRTSEPFFTRAIYDTLTVAIDMESGAVTHTRSPLYSHEVSVTGTAQGGGALPWRFDHSRQISYTGYKEALAASLPSAHPFKACGTEAWSYLSNRSIALGDSSTSYTATALPYGPFPAEFSLNLQPAEADRLARLKAYSSSAQQRILGGYAYERSTLATGWGSCAANAVLGAYTDDSFTDYSEGALQLREELLQVDGFDITTQDKLLAEPATPPVPSALTRVSGYTTSDRIYFREFDPSNPPAFLSGKAYSDLFWIVD